MDLINSRFNRENEVTCDQVESPIRGTQGAYVFVIHKMKILTQFNKIEVLIIPRLS